MKLDGAIWLALSEARDRQEDRLVFKSGFSYEVMSAKDIPEGYKSAAIALVTPEGLVSERTRNQKRSEEMIAALRRDPVIHDTFEGFIRTMVESKNLKYFLKSDAEIFVDFGMSYKAMEDAQR
jgi:hypothetical protein